MSKKQKYFEKIQEYKDRFRDLTIEELRQKQIKTAGYEIKEGTIAIRELIEEKKQNHSPTSK